MAAKRARRPLTFSGRVRGWVREIMGLLYALHSRRLLSMRDSVRGSVPLRRCQRRVNHRDAPTYLPLMTRPEPQTLTGRGDRHTRALAFGIAIPFLYFGVQIVAARFYPGYSFLNRDASTLGSAGSTA